MSTDRKNIGTRLKIFRNSRNINIVQFSKLCGISHGSLSTIENNKSKPSADTLANLCINTDIDIFWLLTGEGEMIRGVSDEDVYINDLLIATRKVLKSGNQVAVDALEKNIRYFSFTIEQENQLSNIKSRLATLEEKQKEENLPVGEEAPITVKAT